MTLYNVHIYRELRLTFEGIEAMSPAEAATLAQDMPTDQAVAIEDCGGENLRAQVGESDDEAFDRAVTVDFAAERLRGATPDLIELSHEVVTARSAGEFVSDPLYVAAILLLSTLEASD